MGFIINLSYDIPFTLQSMLEKAFAHENIVVVPMSTMTEEGVMEVRVKEYCYCNRGLNVNYY